MKVDIVLILTLVTLLITSAFASLDTPLNVPLENTDCNTWETYDYIVVGGGSAGGVAAARLSEKSSNSVLLLDAGGPSQSSVGGTDFVADRYYINKQNVAVFQRPLTRYDVPAFCYSDVPTYPGSPCPAYPLNTSFGGIDNTSSRILGGNTMHNYMVWDRLTPKSINSWNVSGWSFNDCLPYWQKEENATSLGFKNAPYRGYNGPIQINFAQAKDPAGDVFIKSCVNAGFGYVSDFNDPNDHVGCGQPQFNINNRGIRASSINEYFAPAQSRSNLKLKVNSEAIKIVFSNATVPKAIGVIYVNNNGTQQIVGVRKEIVLSAGTFNTPKLLLLSGIGPAAQLRALKIKVIVNSPVGKRVAIHPVTFALFDYNVTARSPYNINADLVEYATQGTGLYASTATFGEGKLKSRPDVLDFDLNLLFSLNVPGSAQFASLLWGSEQNNGTVSLVSADYRDYPYFDYTPFQNQNDLNALVTVIKYFRKIATTYPGNITFGRETLPGPQYKTDAQLKAYIKAGGAIPTTTHMHGGCVLGNYGDNDAVLDPRLRVKGVSGVRVADLSIVPGLFLAGPMANGVMFGERVSAFILADNA